MGAIGDPYITRAEFKDYLKIDPTKTSYDDRIDDAIASATGEIEQFCGRQFNRVEIATARQYEPDNSYYVSVDDFYTDDGLLVDVDGDGALGWELGYTTYELHPLNGVVDGVPGWPYNRIRLPEGGFPFYKARYGNVGSVSITAKWGWASVPAPVKQACFLLAAQTFKMADAPFGIVGAVTNEFGAPQRVRDLPQVASKLNRFVSTPILIG